MSTSAPTRSRRAHERASWPGRARTVVHVLAVAVLATAVGVLLGWLMELDEVIGIGPGAATVEPTTAVAFGLLAAALLTGRPLARRVLYGLVMVLGALVLAQYAFGVSLGIDGLLVGDLSTGADVDHPGRPAEATALSLVLLALAGLLTEYGRRTSAQVVIAAPLLIAFTAVFGYAYGVDGLYRVGPYSTMAVATAVTLIVAVAAVWLNVPTGILQWLTFGGDTGARLQRVLIPVALVLIPFGAWLYVKGLERELYGLPFGTALMTSFAAFVLVTVGYRVGRTAFRLDQERNDLLEELHRVNAELEDRVRSRSHQLNRQRTKLALFEERDRIARDLHDRVIQRIFAAGLQVASLSRTARKEAAERDAESRVADNLNSVATELDLAIRELRNSIFELTSIDDHDNVEQVVRDIAARASRILGFMPRVEVTGQVAGIQPDLVAQLASVIQEGLSNVARHAHAAAVEVALHATEEHLELRITDDGDGLPDPLPRSSGINNLMNRARQLGGTATWSNASPSGTVLVWRVPRNGVPGPDVQGNETPVASSDNVHSSPASTGS